MTYLIASQILLWIAVLALGALAIALARQVGVLHERIAPAGALTLPSAVKAGDMAPDLMVTTLTGQQMQVGGVRQGRSQLVFFLAPDCPLCKSFLPVLRSAASSEKGWLDIALASDGDAAQHKAFIAAQNLESFPYVLSELLGRSFGVAKLPYAVLIDEGGKIASLGLVNTREHLESLFEAKERGVASIQQYLARR
ncbi:redoxin family protein [Govanella unica]|uniref:Redoxin family protein n=1 Tax=Govanella unica TaxID=2975056 RepID=A0A9X3U0W0_9PROT|nr:redoxin family protein [Govania unica]MDA5195053.1 redoxin family protein [Govania unica]